MRKQLTNVKAVVIGATGACGRYAVDGLVRSASTEKVTVIVRREYDFAAEFGWNAEEGAKLTQSVVPDFDELKSSPDVWEGHTVAICALGTTRKAAGSADVFVKVDRDYVASAAELAKKASVSRFCLLTAQGTRKVPSLFPHSMISIVHPLLYTQTKFEAEAVVKAQNFSNLSIFRPGLLDRRVPGADKRYLESALLNVVPSTKASTVGYAMAEDATTEPASELLECTSSDIEKLALAHETRNNAGVEDSTPVAPS